MKLSRVSRVTTIAWLAGACAATIAGAFVARPALAPTWWPGRPLTADLVAAVGAQRIVEPRLTGGFSYAPVTASSPTRSGARGDESQSADVRLAALKIEKQMQSARSASTLGSFGAAALVTGRVDAAVGALEEATRLDPGAARLQSDLAAAYLTRFKQSRDLDDVLKAVSAATAATETDPKLAEARFNLALALESLSLANESRKAWESFIQVDAGSAWTREARERADALEPEALVRRQDGERQQVVEASASADRARVAVVVGRLPDVAYEYIESELIPRWAGAWLARDSAAAQDAVARATMLAEALSEAVGERMPLDATTAIERASRGRDGDALARAHQSLARGRKLFDQDKYSDSALPFREAYDGFDATRSPMREWAGLYLATDDYYQRPPDQVSRQLDPLITEAREHRHSIVLGRALRLRGLTRVRRGMFGDSFDDYRAALLVYERVRARQDVASIHMLIADAFYLIGESNLGGRHEVEALNAIASIRAARVLQMILFTSGRKALQQGRLHAALAFQNELLVDAASMSRVSEMVQAYQDRAQISELLGKSELAVDDLRAALKLVDRVDDPAIADQHRAELALTQGEIIGATNPAEAIALLDGSRKYFVDQRIDQRLPRVYLGLGRAQRALGRYEDAAAAFTSGIGVLERQRPFLPTGGLRLGYFEQPWNLYHEYIDLVSGPKGNPAQALAVAERARARSLLEIAAGSDAVTPIDPAALKSALQSGEAVVYYASLPSRLLIWVVRSEAIDFHQQPISSVELGNAIGAYRSAVQDETRSADPGRLSEQLFDTLIAPYAASLPPDSPIVIVPDGALHQLPFGALRNPRTKRYLVEDHEVHVTSSATMFLRARGGRARPRPADARVLVMGNPLIAPEDGAGLPDLSYAEREARTIAALYPEAVVAIGHDATKSMFLSHAGATDIVHFAGHAIANDANPLLSRLLLAGDAANRSGALYANELLEMRFERTSLVVLAACRTGVGPIRKGEGPIGLARPFLARGVPSVIATLWDVNDQASAAFFEIFYRALHDGKDVAGALRGAQIAMLRHDDARLRAPSRWAGFIALGS